MTVKEYKRKRYLRIMGRLEKRYDSKYNADASARLAYGLAKKYGIDTTGMEPQEVWAALKKEGVTPENAKGKQMQVKHGKKLKESSATPQPKQEPAKYQIKAEHKIHFQNNVTPKKLVDTLSEAKKSLPEAAGPWRVTSYESGEQFDEWHPGAKKHVTEGGSTIAVADDGDIVAVCHNANDTTCSGSDLLMRAVYNGGTKLDAYEKLYGFYAKCGFEPVSWCKWDQEFAPPDWVPGKNQPENIIFYKYTGKAPKYKNAAEFMKAVKADNDYDAARERRDKEVK